MEFMSTCGDEVNGCVFQVEIDMTNALYCIRMKQCAMLPAKPDDRRGVQQISNFIVDHHEADHAGIIRFFEKVLEVLQIDISVVINPNVINRDIVFLFYRIQRMQNGMMLNLRTDKALDSPISGGILQY